MMEMIAMSLPRTSVKSQKYGLEKGLADLLEPWLL